MKKGFSLFESILVLLIFVVVLVLLSKPLLNISHFYKKDKDLVQNMINLNLSLIFIDKILKKCINFKSFEKYFSCTIFDDAILSLRKNTLLINYSGIILKKENSYYSPKSFFLADNFTASNRLSILEKQKIMHNKKDENLRLFSLKEKKEYNVRPINKEDILFLNDEFSGFYKLIDTEISFFLREGVLFYRYNDKTSILLENLRDFSIKKEDKSFKITLCQKNLKCFHKWSFE